MAAAAVHRRRWRTTGGGKRPGGTSDSPRFHSCGRFERRMTGEADRQWSKASSGSNGDRRWRGRFRPGEAGLGVGEGGGGAGEEARARIEVWWPEEGDRRKGASAERAELVSDRWEEEGGGDDSGGPQQGKYLGVTLADSPPIPNGPSAVFLGVTLSF